MSVEGEMVELSTIQHYTFCPRQAFLIHGLGLFRDDARTAAGSLVHEYTDKRRVKTVVGGYRITRAYVVNDDLGYYGIPDAIELDDLSEPTRIHVIENKINNLVRASEIQVVGAALALRFMYPSAAITAALYSYDTKQSIQVDIEQRTAEFLSVLTKVRTMTMRNTPRKESVRRCSGCSLKDDCLPSCLMGRY